MAISQIKESMRYKHITEEAYKEMQERGRRQRISQMSAGKAKVPTPRKFAPYKSKWELLYAQKLNRDKADGLVTFWYYEPFSLWLPGHVRYTPDFLLQDKDGIIHVVEIKGWSPNLRDGMTRLKVAAAVFPCFEWQLVSRERNGEWTVRRP